MSEEINKRFGSRFVLGENQNLPHITLLHAAFPKRNVRILKNRLSALSKKTPPFQAHVKGFLAYPQAGFMTVEVAPKSKFVTLHREVSTLTKDLIDRSFDYRAVWDYPKLPKKAKKYVDKYATPVVKEYFIPHMTLSLLKDKGKLAEVEATMSVEHHRFRAETLALCTLAEHHTCQEVVFSIPLGRVDKKDP
ncbi:2'-5' RNA ligase family protein [Patescibacteria group bacterium]|nr:2'-5' RNA ligase family protein [Patescibacteria group bacterium]